MPLTSLERNIASSARVFDHPLRVIRPLLQEVGIRDVSASVVSNVTHEIFQSIKFSLSGYGEMGAEWGFGKGDRSLFTINLTDGSMILISTAFRKANSIVPTEEQALVIPAPDFPWFCETVGYLYDGSGKLLVFRDGEHESTLSLNVAQLSQTIKDIRSLVGVSSEGIEFVSRNPNQPTPIHCWASE